MLSIVVLHYGDEQQDMASEAVRHVLANTTGEFELLVWVNGGTWDDDLVDPRLKVYESGYRDGLAKAYNRAVLHTAGDSVCIMHNDCFVPPGWNDALESMADDEHIAFPVVETNDAIARARGIPSVPEWMPPSCCFVISRSLLFALKGWDEQFEFCHFEDMDLFYRAQLSGVQLIQCPSSTVFHLRGVTRAAEAKRANVAFQANQRLYILKHGTKKPDGTYEAEFPVMTLALGERATYRPTKREQEASCHSTTMESGRI